MLRVLPSAAPAAVGAVLLARRSQDGRLYALKQVQLSGRSAREQLEAVREAQVSGPTAGWAALRRRPAAACRPCTSGAAGAGAANDASHTVNTSFALPHPQLLAALDSPYITRYYDSFLHEDWLCIVMEFAPGGRCALLDTLSGECMATQPLTVCNARCIAPAPALPRLPSLSSTACTPPSEPCRGRCRRRPSGGCCFRSRWPCTTCTPGKRGCCTACRQSRTGALTRKVK